MPIEEKLEKYRDEFLECKTPEAFLVWGRKWRELITDEKMADEEMVDSILGKEFEEVYDRNSEYKKKLKDTLLEKGLLLAIKVGIITTLLGSTFILINSLALMTIGLPLTVAVPAIYAHYEMKRLDKKFDMYNELLEMTQDRIDQIYTEMESIQYEKQAILTSIKRIKSKELALMAYKENKIDDFVIIDDVKRLVRK